MNRRQYKKYLIKKDIEHKREWIAHNLKLLKEGKFEEYLSNCIMEMNNVGNRYHEELKKKRESKNG